MLFVNGYYIFLKTFFIKKTINGIEKIVRFLNIEEEVLCLLIFKSAINNV